MNYYDDTCRRILTTITVLPQVETKNLTAADVDDLTNSVRENMLAELVRLTEIARGQGTALSSRQTYRESKKTS